jgi:hypothetical protein
MDYLGFRVLLYSWLASAGIFLFFAELIDPPYNHGPLWAWIVLLYTEMPRKLPSPCII